MARRPQPVWRGTNLARIGDFNEAVLIDAIRRSPDGLSRVELVDTTGLSPQTISNITRRMIDTGMVLEGERLRGGMGKPRTILRLNPQGSYAVGVHLDPWFMTFVLLDLHGTVIEHARRATPPAAAPESVLAEVDGAIRDLLDRADVDRSRIAGIGFASPGPIDVEAGVVLDPPHLPDWRNVPLRDHLSRVTGLPVILDKDVTAAAVGERWAGASLGHRTSLFLYLGTGIGTGVIVDDHVLRGSTGNAGDIGHLVVAPDGFACECGARGCLGIMLSPAGIARQAVAAGALDEGTALHDVASAEAALDRLADLAGAGDGAARRTLDTSAEHLARAARTLANLLDTEIVVFGGPTWTRLAPFWLERVDGLVRTGMARGELGELVVTGTALGEDVGAIGAASLVLDRSYSPRPSAFVLD